jgi:hypothetical protein
MLVPFKVRVSHAMVPVMLNGQRAHHAFCHSTHGLLHSPQQALLTTDDDIDAWLCKETKYIAALNLLTAVVSNTVVLPPPLTP